MARFLWTSLIFALAVAACARSDNFRTVRNLTSAGENIICFGDSLTEGVGAEKGEDYPSILARQLPYPVINAGHRGDTTADGLSRLERDVLKRNPRLVVVFFGGNDFLRQVPLSETRNYLEAITLRVQERGAMVALAGARFGLFTDEYSPMYKGIAERHGALLIPEILKGILSDPKLKSDPIHPNNSGYRLMAERILAKVKPLLEEADRKRLKG